MAEAMPSSAARRSTKRGRHSAGRLLSRLSAGGGHDRVFLQRMEEEGVEL